MKISRRDFIGTGFKSMLGGVIAYNSVPTLLRYIASPDANQVVKPNNLGSEEHYWRFIVDIRKCIGCGKCIRACKEENDVPPEPEHSRTWIERYVITETEEILVDSPDAGINGFTAEHMNTKYKNLDIAKSFFVPKLCNHCANPPCVPVCPVGATYINNEGVVLVNRKACIGCRYCIQACPYGARFLDPRLKVVDKCTWCYHRITKSIVPACVEVCPVEARVFGDIRDTADQVTELIRKETLGILKPEIGCDPKVYYIGKEKGVR
jgi:Fe-S-cluster-containing dehydrogenase component